MARKSAKSATVGNPTLPAQYSAFGSVVKRAADSPGAAPNSSDSRIRRRYGRRVAKDQVSVDPAMLTKDAAPNLGRDFLPQIITFSGMQSTVSHVYRNPDEAIRHSLENARFMRNDCSIMESLEARQRGTALLNYHLEPEDAKDPKQKELVTDLQAILEEIERFTEYRRNLLEAIWYGRTAIKNLWERRVVRGKPRFCIRGWLPVNGDKLAFRYDDGSGKYPPNQIGIRVGGASSQKDSIAGDRQIEVGDFGQCYFLEPWERSLLTVHKHMIEDGAFEDPISAGRVHGVGVRDRIYWCWFQKQETMAQLMEVIERTGTGFTIYYYQYGNAEDKAEMLDVAQRQAPSNVILMPRMSEDPSMNANGIERIEPSTAGITAMREIIGEFFGWQIKRYILGQTLSSEASATGLGSGVADLHQDTFLQIIQYDAVNLEETITSEVVEHLKNYNFPWARDLKIKFKIDTKENESEKKLSGFKLAWDMGCRIKSTDVMDVIGASMPDQDDEVLQNPAMQQQQRLWEQAHPQAGDIGQAGGVVGEDGQESQEGSVEDQFGPIAGLLGNGGGDGDMGGQAGGGNGGPGGGGGGMPGGMPSGPQQYAKQYAKQQVKSSPGQTKLFDHDTSRATSHKWREELHPRDHGKFAEKGAGHSPTATEAPGGIRAKQAKSSPGQGLLGLAGDAAEQIGLPTLPAQPGPGKGDEQEQPFSLSGKPMKVKSLFPGSGKTKQVDLFAGRGDAPGQMSFGDDVDPASKKVGEQGEIAAPKHIGPGDTVTIPASNTFGQFEAEITDEGEGRVGIRQKSSTDARPIAKMHRNQLPQFLDDLNGVIHGKPDSASESINHVLAGKGKFLGRGNDGLAFDAGNGQVVKASSDIPFHWNNGLRDNHEGRNILQNQVKQNEHLRAAGVPGLLPQELHEHGGRTFVTMPKVDTEAKLTPEHVQQLRNTLNKMHDAGYALKDLVQVGVDHEGNARIFDTGAVKKLDKNPTYAKDDMKTDEGNLNYLIKKHGHDEVSLNYERDYHDRAGHTEVYLSRLENNPDKPANLEYLKSHRDSLAKAWEGVDDETKEFVGEDHAQTMKRLDAQIAKHSPEGKLAAKDIPTDRPSSAAPSGPAPGESSGGAPSAEPVKDTTPKESRANEPKPDAGEHDRAHRELSAAYKDPKFRQGDREHHEKVRQLEDQVEFHKPAALARAESEIAAEQQKKSVPEPKAVDSGKPYIGAGDLAEHYRASGMPRHLAWDQFVKDTILSPNVKSDEIDAKEFFEAYDRAAGAKKHPKYPGQEIATKAESPSSTPADRAALPEHLRDVNPAFPSEAEKLKGIAAKAGEKAAAKPAEPKSESEGHADTIRQHLDNDDHAAAIKHFESLKKDDVERVHRHLTGSSFYNQSKAQMLDKIRQTMPHNTKSARDARAADDEIDDARSKHLQAKERQEAHANGMLGSPINDVSDTAFKDPHGEGKAEVTAAWQREVDQSKAALDATLKKHNVPEFSDEQRKELIDNIANASRKPLPNIVERVKSKGSDGKWYYPEGVPFGVKLTDEHQSQGYAYQSPDGTTHGTLGKSKQELIDRHTASQDKQADDYREKLADADNHKLLSHAKTWKVEPPKGEAKESQQELSGAKPVDEAAALARKWKKNDDGTYTSPNGTVWKKAAAGGEESPVTGGQFKGGALMPIHGMHEKPKEKPPKGDGTGGGAGKVKEEGKRPIQPMTAEQRQAELDKRARQAKWDAIRKGPMGEPFAMGEKPGKMHGGTKLWENFVEKSGLTKEQVKELGDHFQAIDQHATESTIPAEGMMWKGEHVSREEAIAGLRHSADWQINNFNDYWRKKWLKSHPDMPRAAYFVGEHISQGEGRAADEVDRIHDVHEAVEKLRRGESLTAKPEAAAEVAATHSPALASAIAAAHQQLHEAGLAEKPAKKTAAQKQLEKLENQRVELNKQGANSRGSIVSKQRRRVDLDERIQRLRAQVKEESK